MNDHPKHNPRLRQTVIVAVCVLAVLLAVLVAAVAVLGWSEGRGALAARSITVAGESVSADVSLAVASPCEPVRVL